MPVMRMALGLFASASTVLASQRDMLVQRKATDLLYSRVKAMAHDVTTTGQKPSSIELEWLEKVEQDIENSSHPSILAGFKDDQALMDDAVAYLLSCETELKADSDMVSKKQSTTSTKEKLHKSCRADESVKATTATKEWEDLANVYSKASPPTPPTLSFNTSGGCYKDFADEFESKMDQFTTSSIKFAEGLEHKYQYALEQYEKAEAARSAQQLDCNKAQKMFEAMFCLWTSAASQVLEKHQECWKTGSNSFDVVKATVLDSVAQWKFEYTAVEKILCMVKQLKALVSTGTADLDSCDAMDVDVSFFSLTNTSTPDKSNPYFGNLRMQPGNPVWESKYYKSLASNSPAAPVMPCPGNGAR
eukprot:gb/GFBE01035413.1/.p1 GENE.gb/GFBE01035413.1/~~gb/GFBE01035413.1/.p1  ORF type:complete len:361 (+),score=105.06 gb/GFBE01035413.1/:1-1083(+)